MNFRSLLTITLLTCLTISGCKGGQNTKVVYGTVTVGGEPVQSGEVIFVPIEGTPGPRSMGKIQDGSYRVEARGGVTLGTHRVEVFAEGKTGNMVPGREGAMVEEKGRLGPPVYATEQSPLRLTVSKQETGEFNIEIPE